MKKKIFIIIFAIFVVLACILFIKNNYKTLKFGNNKNNKSVKEVEEYILSINSYKATLEVTVNSNKNTNKYIINQEYSKDNTEKQTVQKPENIEGMEIIYKDGNLELKNSKLNLSKVYNNYPYLADNVLWLNSFIENYKNNKDNTSIYEENGYVVMQINKKEESKVHKLYVEKGTGTPKKMVVQSNNKKEMIYILYTEMNIVR